MGALAPCGRFCFAATGADRARGRCYFGGYRRVVRHSRFFDLDAKHAFVRTSAALPAVIALVLVI